jgi:hypothetical protein
MSAAAWGGFFSGAFGAGIGGVVGFFGASLAAGASESMDDEERLIVASLGAMLGATVGAGVSGALWGARVNQLELQQQNGGQTSQPSG